MKTDSNKVNPQNTVTPDLPTLTESVIQRAREGLQAARNPAAQSTYNAVFANLDRIPNGEGDHKISGLARRFFIRLFINMLFSVSIENPENIPTGPAIIAPNHLNHIDPFLLLSIAPGAPFIYILGDARTLFNKKWKRLLIRAVGGVIPIDRLWKEEKAVIRAAELQRKDLKELAEDLARDVPDGGSISTLRRLENIHTAIFRQGNSLLIFPEGALGVEEGKLRLPLKRGALLYAIQSGAPLVPAAIIGSHDVYLRKKIIVRFGKPLQFQQKKRPNARETQLALDSFQNALESLLPKQYTEPNDLKLFRFFLNHMFW